MNLSLKSPAKINLGLHIHHKREDGYHELETIFQMVGLYDDIFLRSIPSGIKLKCDTPEIPRDSSNLVYRAAEKLREVRPGIKMGVEITLVKRIPSGAGLGGGSGNAACVLLGLNRLWDLKLSHKDLLALGAQLGSDVPFFLTSPCAVGKGRGEKLSPVQSPEKYYVLLIYPGFPVATSWVYQNLNLKLTNRRNNISILRKFLSESRIACVGTSIYNDLESVVMREYPRIQEIKDELSAHGARGTLLSGSGSTVFGIFDDPDLAKNAYNTINERKGKLFLSETVTSFSEFLPAEILNYPQFILGT